MTVSQLCLEVVLVFDDVSLSKNALCISFILLAFAIAEIVIVTSQPQIAIDKIKLDIRKYMTHYHKWPTTAKYDHMHLPAGISNMTKPGSSVQYDVHLLCDMYRDLLQPSCPILLIILYRTELNTYLSVLLPYGITDTSLRGARMTYQEIQCLSC